MPRRLDHVLWDRNPGFLKSEIGPFSDFKRKPHLMDLKLAHSQESVFFKESGEVDRFLKMGTYFKWAPIIKRDRALLITVFVLNGQAFGYAQGICICGF